ncbi:hypothetical protein [Paenibacillus daejeonensis]|uniref:hypothetical protein n=1 Tax=Paenibacillus daejeonensis TaxID=135193 RepID=UPI00146EBD38|nr:hypothetical protein [Paenibacillus daejeonensis]
MNMIGSIILEESEDRGCYCITSARACIRDWHGEGLHPKQADEVEVFGLFGGDLPVDAFYRKLQLQNDTGDRSYKGAAECLFQCALVHN